MLLSGSIRKFDLASVLQFLANEHATGILEARDFDEYGFIYLVEGRVQGISLPMTDEKLGTRTARATNAPGSSRHAVAAKSRTQSPQPVSGRSRATPSAGSAASSQGIRFTGAGATRSFRKPASSRPRGTGPHARRGGRRSAPALPPA